MRSLTPEQDDSSAAGAESSPRSNVFAAIQGLSGPVALACLWLAGVAFFFPAINTRYLLDDFLQASMVRGTFPVPRSPFDLYAFVDDTNRDVLLERGLLPWWTHPEFTIRFFRPLPSALRWLDMQVFGDAPLPPHLHSFLWWMAVVLGARALFRRQLAPRAATFATVIFALAPCHAVPITWLANREALISLALGLPGLWCYLAWRETRAARHAALAFAFFSVAVLGGEYAIALGGYVLALELVRRSDTFFARVTGVLPFAVPALTYLAVRAALGYGAAGSGFYSDPFRVPERFLLQAPHRFAIFMLEGWFSLDNETVGIGTPLVLLVALVAAGLALVAVPVAHTWRAVDAAQRRALTFFLVGSCVSILPMLAVHPSPRVLGICAIGIAATVGTVLGHVWFPAAPVVRRGWTEATLLATTVLAFAHLVHGPSTAWLIGRSFCNTTDEFAVHSAELQRRIGSPAQADVVAMRGGAGGPFFLPFAMNDAHELPAHYRILAQTGHVLVLRRGPRTLELITSRNDCVFPPFEGNLFLDSTHRFETGQVIERSGMRVTIGDVIDGRPRTITVDFDRDLSEYVWINDTRIGYIDATPPAEGLGAPFDP